MRIRNILHPLYFSADPETTALARLPRAEAYMALKQYRLALEDAEFFCGSELLRNCSAEVGHLHVLSVICDPRLGLFGLLSLFI